MMTDDKPPYMSAAEVRRAFLEFFRDVRICICSGDQQAVCSIQSFHRRTHL